MDLDKAYHQQQQQQIIKCKRRRKSSGGAKKTTEKEAMKVTYILTPMKVKTSASKFREIVQKLTGWQSDVARIMESKGGDDTLMVPSGQEVNFNEDNNRVPVTVEDDKSSPSISSSEELIQEQFDGYFGRNDEQQEMSFGVFEQYPSMWNDQMYHQVDVLGNY